MTCYLAKLADQTSWHITVLLPWSTQVYPLFRRQNDLSKNQWQSHHWCPPQWSSQWSLKMCLRITAPHIFPVPQSIGLSMPATPALLVFLEQLRHILVLGSLTPLMLLSKMFASFPSIFWSSHHFSLSQEPFPSSIEQPEPHLQQPISFLLVLLHLSLSCVPEFVPSY